MIEIKNLTKIYEKGKNEVRALNDVSFTLPDKGLVFIVGKSGSGKSTFINMLGGLDDITSGSILVDKLDITKLNPSELDNYRNHYLGIIYQNYNLFENETVLENIKLASDISDNKVTDEDIEELMKELDVYKNKEVLVKNMSGGQKQRVAIARALIKNPELILADEPTGNLDSKTTKIIFDLLKKISEDKLIVVISHDDKSATTYADRIIRISDGIITDNLVRNENKKEANFIPVYDNVDDSVIEEVNKTLKGSKYQIGKKEKDYIPTIKEITSNREPLNIHKYKLNAKNSYKTAIKFLKNSRSSLISTLLLSVFIVSLLSLALCFSFFDGAKAINSIISNHNISCLDINKSYSQTDNVNNLEKDVYIGVNEEDINMFSEVYEGNIYKKYIFPLMTNTSNYSIEQSNKIDKSNFSAFYSNSGGGLIVCDTDFLIDRFNGIDILAGSLYNLDCSIDLIVTDYFADSILCFNPTLKSKDTNDPYQNIIGVELFNRYKIGAIINTGYKERYSELITLYNRSWASPTDSQKISKDISNSMLLLDFIDEAYISLNIAYSINPNFIEEYINELFFARFNNAYVYDVEDPSTAKINLGVTDFVYVNEELNEGEILISTKLYNQLFGTSITGEGDPNFEEKEIFIENFGLEQERIDEPHQILTLKVVGIDNTFPNIPNLFFVSRDTLNTLASNFIKVYGLQFAELDKSYDVYKVFKPAFYYSQCESFNSVFTLIDIVNIFSMIFSLTAILLLLILFIIIVSHNLRIIRHETYRIGVYKSLGYSNLTLTLSVFIDNIFTIILIFALSAGFTFGINYYADLLLKYSLANILGNDIYMEMTLLDFKFIYVLFFNGIIFIFTILSSFIPLLSIRRIKPNQIIRNAE